MNSPHTTPQEAPKPLDILLRDLPLHQLVSLDPSKMTVAELHMAIKHCQEQRVSSQARRVKAVRAATRIVENKPDPLADF